MYIKDICMYIKDIYFLKIDTKKHSMADTYLTEIHISHEAKSSFIRHDI